MTLERDRRRHTRSRFRFPAKQTWKVSPPLASGPVAALVVALVPAQFKALATALLAAILIAAIITILSESPRGRHPPGEGPPNPASPHWVFVVTLMAVGGTTILAIRLPGNLTIGDALLAVALVGVLSQPGVTTAAVHAMPRWFWWSTSLVLLTGAIATLRPEVIEPGNISTAVRTWSAMALVPFLIVAVGSTARRLHAIAAAFVLGASLNALAAIAQAAGLWDPAAALGVPIWAGRTTGLSVHPNHLGMACALAAPIALALAAQSLRPLRRYAWVALWLILALGVTSSGSRAALGGLLLGSALLVPLTIRSRDVRPPARGVDLGLPLALISVALALWLLPRMASFSDSLLVIVSRLGSPDTLAASDAGRVSLYSEGVQDVSKYWLIGRGFEESTRDHNIFLQAVLSGGILFLAGLLIYIWKPVAQAVKRLATTRDPILWGALASFLLWPVMGLAQPNLRDRFLFVALGLVLAALRATLSNNVEDTPTGQSIAPEGSMLAVDVNNLPARILPARPSVGAGRSRITAARTRRQAADTDGGGDTCRVP